MRAPARRGAAAPSLARAALLCALACVASSPLPLSSRPHGGALLPVASARPLTNGDAAEVQPEQLDLASAHAPGWHGFVDPTRVEVLSNGPVTRAYVYRGLLTPEECDHIVGVSQTRLMRSGVVDTETGASAVSEIRTSSGTFLGRKHDGIIASVEHRIAEWSQVPEENGEGLQILKYEHGEKYDAHYDYFFHSGGTAAGGNRLATALIYLSDVEEGGETVFPNGPREAMRAEHGGGVDWSPCAQKGPAVRPRKGDVLLFWSLAPNGVLDSGSLHGGCPVISGTKWSATKWMHVAPFSQGRVKHNEWSLPTVTKRGDCSPGHAQGACCQDNNKECAHWGSSGECENNPGYMVGNASPLPDGGEGWSGTCALSCGKCEHLPVAGWSSDES